MIKTLSFLLLAAALCGSCGSSTERSAATPGDESMPRPSEYVSTLVGSQSDYSFSTGNTYPAVALPWGMNFWTPQTGKMGRMGLHLRSTHHPGPEADTPAITLDQRLRAVLHYARARTRQGR